MDDDEAAAAEEAAVDETAVDEAAAALELRLGDVGPEVAEAYAYLQRFGYFPNPELAAQFPGWTPAEAAGGRSQRRSRHSAELSLGDGVLPRMPAGPPFYRTVAPFSVVHHG